MRWTGLGAGALATLGAVGVGVWSTGASQAPITPETPHGDEETPPHEGIHVVGNWELDVVDREGVVVEHRAFHNDLTSTAASFLLSRLFLSDLLEDAILGWTVRVTINDEFESSGVTYVEPQLNTNDVLSAVALLGDFSAATEAHDVTAVKTWVHTCDVPLDPVTLECDDDTGFTFTSKTLATPLRILPDQALRARVTITFR